MALLLIPRGALAHWMAMQDRLPMLLSSVVFMLHLLTFSFLLAPIEGVFYVLSDTSPVFATASSLFAPLTWGVYWLSALKKLTGETLRGTLRIAISVYVAFLLVGVPVFLIQVWLGR